MNDTYSFFRYTLPGVLFLIELTFAILFLDYSKVVNFIYSEQEKILTLNMTLTVIVLTFISFGFGALLSLFYRVIPNFKIDYSNFLLHLIDQKLIEIENYSPTVPKPPILNLKKYGWVIMSSLWFEKSESYESVKGSTARSQSLANLLHNSAASLAGSIIAFIFLIVFICLNGGFCNFQTKNLLISFISLIIFLILHTASYCDAKFTLKNFTEIVLWNSLKNKT